MNFRIVLACVAAAASLNAQATPGAFEINQACVADGCFSGDAPGFPVTVSQPGIYVLSSNVEVSDYTQTAIAITADDVSLELNGFRVSGPNVCTGQQADCTSNDNEGGVGIDSVNTRNVSIRNGVVNGFGFAGVNAGESNLIDRIHSQNNGRAGFRMKAGSTITNSLGTFNGYIGISANEAARIIDCSAFNNGQFGMTTSQGSVLDRVILKDNPTGIYDWHGSVIKNASFSSANVGVYSGNGGTKIIDSVFFGHTSSPVFNQGGAEIVTGGLPVTLSGNTFYDNGGVVAGGTGPYIELGPNVCDQDTACGI
jgi:hypothetical protein